MSLDFYLEEVQPTMVWQGNITHNLAGMAMAAGLYRELWDPDRNTTGANLVPILEKGLAVLLADPAKFRLLQPRNGWGSYEDLVDFVRRVLAACREHPDAKTRASV